MGQISTNEFKSGVKILLDQHPCSIIDNEFVKPGKGQAFNRVKLRNLTTGRMLEKTFKSGESFEVADVVELEMQYMYQDEQFWYFMDPETFEQLPIDPKVLEQTKLWIKEQDLCTVTLFNGQPIIIVPPTFVVLEISETDPGLRGDTSSGGTKPATLVTGAVVRVPLFVQLGEKIKVDTREGTYVSREL